MGIKTKFNPMGGGNNEKGKLSDWRYSTASNGQITLYEYLGTYSSIKPVYVPVKKGKTVINNYTSGSTTTASNTPFYNNPSVISVDLQNVPFVSNNMSKAFNNCQNLISVTGINQNVTSMGNTFYNCYNLNQNIQIPNSVTNMYATFYNCTNLNQNIQISNRVTGMSNTFQNCRSLNQNIQIPNSVTSMYSTFCNCTSLNQNIQIPNRVTYMTNTFNYCTNLQGTITISSANVTNTNYCFNGSGLAKNVIFPLRYINNVNTATRNSLVTAATGGYAVGTAVGNLVNNTAQNAVFHAYDPVAWEGYNTWSGDGTHWTLSKWAGIGKAAGTTEVTVPSSITSYDTFPTVLAVNCFNANSTVTYIDCNNVPFTGTALTNAFKSTLALKTVDNINVPSTVTAATNMFYDSRGLEHINLDLPSSVTGATRMFVNCKNCTDFVLNAPGLTTMTNCFALCNSKPINVTITSPNISTVTNQYRGYVTTQRKNIYIYYQWSNGTYTPTFNAHKLVTYMGTTGNATTSYIEPRYNSTSNFYIYDLTNKYRDTNVANILSDYTYTQSGSTYNLTKYTGRTYAKVPKKEQVKLYPDSTSTTTYGVDTVIYNNCFNNISSLVSVDLQNVPFISNNMNGAFYSCRNLTSVYNINPNVTNMYNTFFLCTNLNHNIQIPNSVTNMVNTFQFCYNLNQNIQIPNSVTDMSGTFQYCTNLNQNIQIPNSVTSMAWTFSDCTNLNQNIQIPNSVTDMSGTFQYCRSLNQNIQIPNSVTNMYNTFQSCYNLNQNIQIPNSVTNMVYTFWDCTNLNHNIQIPNSVTNMFSTFTSCINLQGTINVLSNQVANARRCFYSTSLPKNVYIPFKYSNGVNSATFNSFVAAGYIYANGVSNSQHGVTMHDLNA